MDDSLDRTTTFPRVVCLAKRRTEHGCRSDQQTNLAVLSLYTFKSCWWTSSKFIKGDCLSHSHRRDREELFSLGHIDVIDSLGNADRSFAIWENLSIEWNGKWNITLYFCGLCLVHKVENIVVRHPSKGDLLCFTRRDSNHRRRQTMCERQCFHWHTCFRIGRFRFPNRKCRDDSGRQDQSRLLLDEMYTPIVYVKEWKEKRLELSSLLIKILSWKRVCKLIVL